MDEAVLSRRAFTRSLVVGGIWVGAGWRTQALASPQRAPAVGYEVGQLAPALAAHDAEGQVRELSEFRNRAVLLQFGARWCVPCRDAAAVLPAFRAEIEAAYGRNKLVVVDALLQGLQTGARPSSTREDAQLWEAEFPGAADVTLHCDGDRGADVFTQYDHGYGPEAARREGEVWTALPTWVGIDATGVIAGYAYGYTDELLRELTRVTLDASCSGARSVNGVGRAPAHGRCKPRGGAGDFERFGPA